MAVVMYDGTPDERKQLQRDRLEKGTFNVLVTHYDLVMRDKSALRKVRKTLGTVCLSVCLSVCLTVCPSFCLTSHFALRKPVCLSICTSVCAVVIGTSLAKITFQLLSYSKF